MNSITPAAAGRAGAGFQVIKAGPGIIFRAVWHRCLLWLLVRFLPLVILTCLNTSPAQANGVTGTIGNGQTVTGNVTGDGFDTYTITSPIGGSSFVLSIGETGIHDTNFLPAIDLTGPGSSTPGVARPLNAKLEEINAAAGTWTVNVRRGDRGRYERRIIRAHARAGAGRECQRHDVPRSVLFRLELPRQRRRLDF